MSLTIYIVATALAGCMSVSGQGVSDEELARFLANRETRKSAVEAILTSTSDRGPLLLSWIQTPPALVDRGELYIGLADAFGQLRTRGAIPFLVKYIGMQRSLVRLAGAYGTRLCEPSRQQRR
jgi:hypothetical protein